MHTACPGHTFIYASIHTHAHTHTHIHPFEMD